MYFPTVESPAEKIIVFDAYDTVVQANLVKTKLDAYGIPCFLSEENFTAWYPFRNQLFPGVRLHIFERDYAQVKELLEENLLSVEATLCPRCGSKKVTVEDEGDQGKTWFELVSLFLFITPRKRVYHCQDCHQQWD